MESCVMKPALAVGHICTLTHDDSIVKTKMRFGNSALDFVNNAWYILLICVEFYCTESQGKQNTVLSSPKKFSAQALSRQFPFLDILCLIPLSFSIF